MANERTALKLTKAQRRALEQVAGSQAAEHRSVIRAKLILLLAVGESVSAVHRIVGLERRIVLKWEKRFREKGLEGLLDAKRSGRPARFPPDRRSVLGEAGV